MAEALWGGALCARGGVSARVGADTADRGRSTGPGDGTLSCPSSRGGGRAGSPGLVGCRGWGQGTGWECFRRAKLWAGLLLMDARVSAC